MAHCLLQIASNDDHVFNGGSKSEWYITPPLNTNSANKNEAKALLITAAQRVWLDLYLNKKALEEGHKVSLNSIGKNQQLIN